MFPELPKRRDSYAQDVSRWFNGNGSNMVGFKVKCGIQVDEDEGKKDFHSFRHTLIDHLKQKQVDTLLLHELDGHSTKSMTLGRYGKKYSPRLLLKQIVEQVDFHTALDLGHLRGSKFVVKP